MYIDSAFKFTFNNTGLLLRIYILLAGITEPLYLL